MSSVNKVIIVGNVGKDPEIRSFPNGGRVANFTVATSESWKKDGERQTKTEWHNISVTNDTLVGIVEKYVKKGSKLYIEGQLQTRKWTDNSGVEKYSTEVVLKPFKGELTLLDSRSSSDQSDNGTSDSQAQNGSAGSGFANDLDDDFDSVPF